MNGNESWYIVQIGYQSERREYLYWPNSSPDSGFVRENFEKYWEIKIRVEAGPYQPVLTFLVKPVIPVSPGWFVVEIWIERMICKFPISNLDELSSRFCSLVSVPIELIVGI